MQTIGAPTMTARKPAPAAVPSPFGERLRRARKVRGLGLRALAKAAGVSHATVSLLESGRQDAIEVKAAVALARALGVTVEWLVTGDGEEPKAPDA